MEEFQNKVREFNKGRTEPTRELTTIHPEPIELLILAEEIAFVKYGYILHLVGPPPEDGAMQLPTKIALKGEFAPIGNNGAGTITIYVPSRNQWDREPPHKGT